MKKRGIIVLILLTVIFSFSLASSANLCFREDGSCLENIYLAGTVGIGTSTPGSTLDIEGNLSFSPALGDKISLFDNRIGLPSMYGFGVESDTLYSKSFKNYRWYINTNANQGTSAKMSLTSTGLGIGIAPSSILTLKNNYDTNSRISIGALSIGGNQGKEAGWTRWYLGYNMFWNGNYDTGKWKASDGTYRSIFINDNALRYIIGMPEGQTEWTTAQLQSYTKFSVDSSGNVKANGTICDKNGCIGLSDWQKTGNNIYNTNTGNVGIGTSSPTAKLDVAGDIRIRGDIATLKFYRTTSPVDIAYLKYDNSQGVFDIAANNKNIRFLNMLNFGEAMRITPAGNVGIGTSSPTAKFEVVGNIKATSGNIGGSVLQSNYLKIPTVDVSPGKGSMPACDNSKLGALVLKYRADTQITTTDVCVCLIDSSTDQHKWYGLSGNKC